MTSNADAVPQLLTIDELAERLATSTRHLHRLVSERRIPFLKVGWFLRFDPDAIARWLDSSRQEPEPSALSRRPVSTFTTFPTFSFTRFPTGPAFKAKRSGQGRPKARPDTSGRPALDGTGRDRTPATMVLVSRLRLAYVLGPAGRSGPR